MVIYPDNQVEFDNLVRTAKQNAKHNFSICSFLNGHKTPNFTNYLEIIEYMGQRYLVKTPKCFSDLLYYAKSIANFIKGKEFCGLWFSQRQEHESKALDELLKNNINVPERVFTEEKGVVVLRYYDAEETKSVLRDEKRYCRTLANLSCELGKIHQIGLHGESSTNNTFVFCGDSYWADFERFSREVSNIGRAGELAGFIKSAARHSYRPLEDVAPVVFESYPYSQVVDLARKAILMPKEKSGLVTQAVP